MTYTGLELFMDNLKLLSYSNDNPLINNNPQILERRPQIQRLYEELSFMIQIMFSESQINRHESEQVKKLKKRFKDLAQEAHSIMGIYVYAINYRNTTGFQFKYTGYRSIENVMKDLKLIREEFIMNLDGLKIDSSPTIKVMKTQTASVTSRSRNPLGMKKEPEEIVVGLDCDAKVIMDKLVEDQKQLDVVSIVGMGGVGKTTLATKVYNDRYCVHHFHVRAWVTVSQSYERRDLLIQILKSIGTQFDPLSASHSKLHEKLHKTLMHRRYFIVIDDVWSTKAWDDLKLFFPNNHTGSRILITSRLKEVALHAKSDGLIYQLKGLTDDESWELLCKKVFHGNDCPESLIGPGMDIAKNCQRLPLAVVVIAGVLVRVEALKDSWERIAQKVSSYIVNDKNWQVDILGLSYEHLPPHLKDCFLYLSGFPEDHKFQVRKLIWLWIAEGFVQEDGNRSLDEVGEDYLMELVNRNLVVVMDRKRNGAIKAFSIHDLLRELSLERATKGNFCVKINTPVIHHHFVRKYKPRRIFTNINLIDNSFYQPSLFLGEVQSLLCFNNGFSLGNNTNKYFIHYPLLTVLDLRKCRLKAFPKDIGLLVYLRYLAFQWNGKLPYSIYNLWSLHTLVVRSYGLVALHKAISNLVNLRHLYSEGRFLFPAIEKPMNLHTISEVFLDEVVASWDNCFPYIKKLTCITRTPKNQDFKLLNLLETLFWTSTSELLYGGVSKILVAFPASLKKLSLSGCCLPWSDMSIIQCLPNLEVLNILSNAFWGPRWDTGEEQFQQLKFLKIQCLNIQQWEASSINFPRLEHLLLDACEYLEAIPLEVGDIPTLKLIDIDDSSSSVVDSVEKIQEEQQNFANYDLKIIVRKQMRTTVGQDHDAELIIRELIKDKNQLDVVHIVGNEGIGKTALATRIFNDPFVVSHFHVRAWVTAAQTYGPRALLIQILASIGIQFDHASASDSELDESLHKCLLGMRYMIVLDDLKGYFCHPGPFPDSNSGSRILITSRYRDSFNLQPHLIHELKCLADEESWELLCKKVFHGNDCPESLIEPGMKIAKSCRGLPKTIVSIARLLSKSLDKDSWERIARRVDFYIKEVLDYDFMLPPLSSGIINLDEIRTA